MTDPLAHAALPTSGITEHFSEEARAALAGYGEFVAVEPNTNLVDEGSELNRLYILASGNSPYGDRGNIRSWSWPA